MSIICAKYQHCSPSFARRVSARSSAFAIQRTCAAPTPAFSGRRSNHISEMLWRICASLRKASSGSPASTLTCSQKNIGPPLGPIEEHRILGARRTGSTVEVQGGAVMSKRILVVEDQPDNRQILR